MKIIPPFRRVANLLLIIMIIGSTLSLHRTVYMFTCTLPYKANFIDLGNLISRVAHSHTIYGSREAGKVHAGLEKGD